jgi:hypothetical protein
MFRDVKLARRPITDGAFWENHKRRPTSLVTPVVGRPWRRNHSASLRLDDLTIQLMCLTTELLDTRKAPPPPRSWWQRLVG